MNEIIVFGISSHYTKIKKNYVLLKIITWLQLSGAVTWAAICSWGCICVKSSGGGNSLALGGAAYSSFNLPAWKRKHEGLHTWKLINS